MPVYLQGKDVAVKSGAYNPNIQLDTIEMTALNPNITSMVIQEYIRVARGVGLDWFPNDP